MINKRVACRDAEDHHLVARVLSANDTDAFGELIRRHQSQVRNFLRRLTADLPMADDLAQDCFLHAWDKLHTYSGRGSFIGWLLKVAYTTFLQSKRRSNRYAEILKQAGHVADAESRSYTRPADEVSDVEKLLAVLPEEERAVMIMSYACGLSHREISEATGQPVGTIKSIIFRGKEKIRTDFGIKDYQHG
ncbi:MAG: sigma-70 family RNA polymerase sigma factor [Woeseiaceae bacterium]|nr:sigma-70 family RNA polymerase sigma factor [Woeseiaceae bacterium]